ncbi:MAG: acylphosphatase [archaeon]
MKKSTRLFLTGSVGTMFFENYIKENAEKLDVKGFLRKLEDGRTEIFLEGDNDKVNEMASICRRGSQHTQIRHVEEKPEHFQDFREFRILRI